MDTVTISTKEYRKLTGVHRTTNRVSGKKSGKKFADSAFGVLKNSFGRTSSAAYVAKLRKS
jgi:hypothetical protein